MYGTHMRSSSTLRGKCYFVPNSNLFKGAQLWDFDFDDFHTTKSLWGGDFGVKIKVFFYIQGFIWGREIPYAHAQSNFKEDFFFVWAQNFFFLWSF
jgi:hypothetical protein